MSFHPPPERFRVTDGPLASIPNVPYGAFIIDSPIAGWSLAVICDDGLGPGEDNTNWEHVSVRAFRNELSRIPSWKEMCFVKNMCWEDEDAVMQLHPPKSSYINTHMHVLHLWRPIVEKIPLPDVRLV